MVYPNRNELDPKSTPNLPHSPRATFKNSIIIIVRMYIHTWLLCFNTSILRSLNSSIPQFFDPSILRSFNPSILLQSFNPQVSRRNPPSTNNPFPSLIFRLLFNPITQKKQKQTNKQVMCSVQCSACSNIHSNSIH